MKPENALLDEQGHLRLSDFGLSRQLRPEDNWKTVGRAGTMGYLAPEVLRGEPHGFESDVWSFGVVVFEMLHAKLPWDVNGPILSNQDAANWMDGTPLDGSVHVSKKLSKDAISLLKGLLQFDSRKRLGCVAGGRGWEDVKNHQWFRTIDWKRMAERRIRPPIKPREEKNAAPDAAIADAFQDEDPKPIPPEKQALFTGWEYNVDIPEGEQQTGCFGSSNRTSIKVIPESECTIAPSG